MKVSRIEISKEGKEFLESMGITKLHPPQADSVRAGLLKGRSIVVSAPTASGKTLIAMLAIMKHIERGGKAAYLSPLRALASEKFKEFKDMCKMIGARARISTGDLDSAGGSLGSADIIVMTNEKMDSILRHRAEWIDEITLLVVDEIHLVGESRRGPTLEMILTQMKRRGRDIQVLGLSATISNAGDIAEWLESTLVESDWRPVPLTEGLYQDSMVTMHDGRTFEIEKTSRGGAVDLGIDSARNGGQCLIFASTRPSAAATAVKASKGVARYLTKKEAASLERSSARILEGNDPTETVKKLANVLRDGAAFHHAGLNQECRSIVEEEFRAGNIKILSSTPTLAAGVNLPARRVVITRLSRYNPGMGFSEEMSVREYKQICGRAGRPQYDEYGEAIAMAPLEMDEFLEKYVEADIEPVKSSMLDKGALATHLLGAIVINPAISQDELYELFSSTLGGRQALKDSEYTVELGVDVALEFLECSECITEKGKRYAATKFGAKTSMMYIDPATAVSFRNTIRDATRSRSHMLGFLYIMTKSDELLSRMNLRNDDHEIADDIIEKYGDDITDGIDSKDCSRNLLGLVRWIEETPNLRLAEELNIESGDMHTMADKAGWLCGCMREFARLEKRADLVSELDILGTRIKYGVKPGLVELVGVREIGRVRARRLYAAGIKTRADIAAAPLAKLAKTDKIGMAVARKIKAAVSGRRRT